MAKAKQVWLRNGSFQTYTNHWETVGEGPQKVAVTGVTLDTSSVTLKPDQTLQLTATVAPENATNKKVTWSSSNTAVATVSNTGLVSCIAEGSAVITVTTKDGGFTATCELTVRNSEVTEIQIPGWQPGAQVWLTGYVGRTLTGQIRVVPTTAQNRDFNVSIADPSLLELVTKEVYEDPQEWATGYYELRVLGTGDTTVTLTSVDNPDASYVVNVNCAPDIPVTEINLPFNSIDVLNNQMVNDILVGAYLPSNAVKPGEDIVCVLKEGETRLGNGWLSCYDGGIYFNFEPQGANVGDTCVFEIYAISTPEQKFELTITVIEPLESVTPSATFSDTLTLSKGDQDTSKEFTYLPTDYSISSNLTCKWDGIKLANIIIDDDGNGNGGLIITPIRAGQTGVALASYGGTTYSGFLLNVQDGTFELQNSTVQVQPNSRTTDLVVFLPAGTDYSNIEVSSTDVNVAIGYPIMMAGDGAIMIESREQGTCTLTCSLNIEGQVQTQTIDVTVAPAN